MGTRGGGPWLRDSFVVSSEKVDATRGIRIADVCRPRDDRLRIAKKVRSIHAYNGRRGRRSDSDSRKVDGHQSTMLAAGDLRSVETGIGVIRPEEPEVAAGEAELCPSNCGTKAVTNNALQR